MIFCRFKLILEAYGGVPRDFAAKEIVMRNNEAPNYGWNSSRLANKGEIQ